MGNTDSNTWRKGGREGGKGERGRRGEGEGGRRGKGGEREGEREGGGEREGEREGGEREVSVWRCFGFRWGLIFGSVVGVLFLCFTF